MNISIYNYKLPITRRFGFIINDEILLSFFLFALFGNTFTIILLMCLLFFFRYYIPESNKKAFLSPSFGRIEDISIGDLDTTVSIILTVFDPHIQYTPVKSIVQKREYIPGKFEPVFFNGKKTDSNERMITTFKTDNFTYNFTYKIIQIAGTVARTIVNYSNDNLSQGEIFGLIKFGSRVDLIIPNNQIKLNLKKGDYINGGEVLGWIN